MTIASIMAMMQIVDNELDVSVGGADETRSITALNMAQDVFESVLATQPDTLGTVGTSITTTANTEATTWPTSLLRLDTLYMLNTQVTPNQPQWEIRIIQDVGGQAAQWPFPWISGIIGYLPQGFGPPVAAYANRAQFLWAPIPDQVYSIRPYGLFAKTDITSRTQTFEYPDVVAVPMATFATRLLSIGVGDPTDDLDALGRQTYDPVIKMLRQPVRQRPQSRQYSQVHFT